MIRIKHVFSFCLLVFIFYSIGLGQQPESKGKKNEQVVVSIQKPELILSHHSMLMIEKQNGTVIARFERINVSNENVHSALNAMSSDAENVDLISVRNQQGIIVLVRMNGVVRVAIEGKLVDIKDARLEPIFQLGIDFFKVKLIHPAIGAPDLVAPLIPRLNRVLDDIYPEEWYSKTY